MSDNEFINRLNAQGRLKLIGFEPDEAECARLTQVNPGNIYLPFGVGDEDRLRQFYITLFNANSSFLEPDLAAFRGLPHAATFQVVRTVEMQMRRLDTLIAEGAVPPPDYLKIDSQGFELNILQGAGDALANVVGIRLETQFRPLYHHQATFFDIYAFMNRGNIILRDVRLTYPIGYEMVEVEAYFSKNPLDGTADQAKLRIWELIHDIPPGRVAEIRNNALNFAMLTY